MSLQLTGVLISYSYQIPLALRRNPTGRCNEGVINMIGPSVWCWVVQTSTFSYSHVSSFAYLLTKLANLFATTSFVRELLKDSHWEVNQPTVWWSSAVGLMLMTVSQPWWYSAQQRFLLWDTAWLCKQWTVSPFAYYLLFNLLMHRFACLLQIKHAGFDVFGGSDFFGLPFIAGGGSSLLLIKQMCRV